MSDVTLDLIADNYFVRWEPCLCHGDPECGCVDRQQVTGEADLNCLLTNLAVAGALCAAFRIGGRAQYIFSRNHWRPGCQRSPRPEETREP